MTATRSERFQADEGRAAREENDMNRAVSGQRPVPGILDRLNSEVNKLAEDLGILYDRIKPAQSDEGEDKLKLPTDPAQDSYGGSASELTRTIEDVCDRLAVMRSRVVEQRSRIEL